MLKTLFKHEWKSVSKVGGLLCIAMAILTFLGWLCFQSPMWKSLYSNTVSDSLHFADIMSILMLIAYFLAMVAISYGFIIYVAVHMYRKMYTDQGYLTHTLPVTSHQLVASKVLVNGIWMFIINFVMVLSICVVMGAMLYTMFRGLDVDWSSLDWSEFRVGMTVAEAEMGMDFGSFFVWCVVLLLLYPFTSVATIMGCISLGQLSKANKGIMSVVWYFVMMLLIYVAEMIGTMFSMGSMFANPLQPDMGSFYIGVIGSTTLGTIVIAVILYFVSVWINKKKINLV